MIRHPNHRRLSLFLSLFHTHTSTNQRILGVYTYQTHTIHSLTHTNDSHVGTVRSGRTKCSRRTATDMYVRCERVYVSYRVHVCLRAENIPKNWFKSAIESEWVRAKRARNCTNVVRQADNIYSQWGKKCIRIEWVVPHIKSTDREKPKMQETTNGSTSSGNSANVRRMKRTKETKNASHLMPDKIEGSQAEGRWGGHMNWTRTNNKWNVCVCVCM